MYSLSLRSSLVLISIGQAVLSAKQVPEVEVAGTASHSRSSVRNRYPSGGQPSSGRAAGGRRSDRLAAGQATSGGRA